MHRNIRLQIAFDGTHYSGWQRQNNAPTIQGAIEDALATMTTARVRLHGAGRTDAGVHARGMVANFATNATIPCEGFLAGLNSMLSTDIRILGVNEVPLEFHSRYSATGKTYCYSLFTGSVQLPSERLYCSHIPGELVPNRIRECLEYIRGTHDFSSFEGSGSRDTKHGSGRGAIRTLFGAAFIAQPDKQQTFRFRFVGDGFLRHMVRNLVGTLIEAGRKKITPRQFLSVLESRDRTQAGPTAPSCGLTMTKVWYEPLPVDRAGKQK